MNETGVQRVIEDCLSRDPKSCYVAGQDITKEVLHEGTLLAKTDYAIANTLWNLTKDTLSECKKALTIATPYLARNRGKQPSGKDVVVHYYNYIIDEIWLSK
jgi:hypothetical protein